MFLFPVGKLSVLGVAGGEARLPLVARSSHTCFNDMVAQLNVAEELKDRKKQPSVSKNERLM